MNAYSDYMGIPVAKSTELLQQILRQEWGFNGFIVSDCGAIGNLTAVNIIRHKIRLKLLTRHWLPVLPLIAVILITIKK